MSVETMPFEEARKRLVAFSRDDPIEVNGRALVVIRELRCQAEGDAPEQHGLRCRDAQSGPGGFTLFLTIGEVMSGRMKVREGGQRRWR